MFFPIGFLAGPSQMLQNCPTWLLLTQHCSEAPSWHYCSPCARGVDYKRDMGQTSSRACV